MRLESNSQSAEELAAVLEAHGYETETTSGSEEVKVISAPDKASPGESPSGTEPGKTDPAQPEAGKDPKQEPQAAKPAEPAEPKPDSKFEPRRKQLERQVARLHEDLDLERGSKASLQTKLAELEAKLAELTPAVADKPKVDEGPVKPKRPTRAECEYDDDKYEAAMDKYDTELTAYNAAVVDKTVNDRLAANARETEERTAKAEADKTFNEFVERRNTEAATIEGYDDVLAEAGDFTLPDLVQVSIIRSDTPAALLHFFCKDHLDNDGKELARISRLIPELQVREMTKLELRLIAEKKPIATEPKEPKTPKAAAPVVEEKKPVETPVAVPAKPTLKPEDAPLEPLGSRTNGRTPTLADAKDMKEYLSLRNQGVSR